MVQLEYLLIFNPTLKPVEKKPSEQQIQDAKIRVFYPEGSDQELQRYLVGILEATVQFMQQWSKQGEKTDIVNSNSQMVIKKCDNDDYIATVFKGNIEGQWILDHLVETIKLFYKDIPTMIQAGAQQFIQKYILFNTVNGDWQILKFMNMGVKYPPLEKQIYLLIDQTMSRILLQYSFIKHFCVFFDGHFLISSFEPQQMVILYDYLYNNGHPFVFKHSCLSTKLNINQNINSLEAEYGTIQIMQKFPQIKMNQMFQTVYIKDQQYNMSFLNNKSLMTVLFSEEGGDVINEDIIKIFDKWMDRILLKLEQIIEAVYRREDQTAMWYFNLTNYAIKFNQTTQIQEFMNSNIKLIENLGTSQGQQIVIKYKNQWGYMSKFMNRMLVILVNGNIPLQKVQSQVNQIIETNFQNILIL